MRFNPDGTPDTSFGPNGDGTLVYDATGAPGVPGAGDFATAVSLDPRNGNILIAGYTVITDSGTGQTNQDIIVSRITRRGAVDDTFDGSGTASRPDED